LSHFETHDPAFTWRAERVDWPVTCDVGPALAGAVACATTITWIDPSRNALAYRGIPIGRVAHDHDFEDTAFLLIDGRAPRTAPDDCASFRRRLGDSRSLPHGVVEIVRGLPSDTHPTRIVRAGISALGCFELTADDDLSGTLHWEDLRIVGQMAELVRIVACHAHGRPVPACDFSSSLAEGVVDALGFGSGVVPDDTRRQAARLLDLCWVLYADHGLDAPTFTGMVVGSCLSDPYYNVVAGLSALRGPLLGGAGERVLVQLLARQSDGPDAARAWVRETIARGERIAGFGHRIYTGADPRVEILRDEATRFAERLGRAELVATARAIEEEASSLLEPRGIYVNVNFYAALVLHLLGAPPPLVPCLYAVGRVVGIVARVREYLERNRLFRPRTRYVGPGERRVVPIAERGAP
jgi:citrate synthase